MDQRMDSITDSRQTLEIGAAVRARLHVVKTRLMFKRLKRTSLCVLFA